MGREEHRRARLVDVLEEPEDVDRELRIEVPGRLVGEEDRGLTDDRARDRDALLLAAGEDAGAVFPATAEADPLERLADACTDEARREPEHLERDRDVVEDGPARDELEVLKDDPDVAPEHRDGVFGEARDVAPEEEDPPVVDHLRTVEEAEERALPCPGRAGDEDELAALDHEVQTSQDRLIGAVRFVDVFEGEDRTPGRLTIEARATTHRVGSELRVAPRLRHERPLPRGERKYQVSGTSKGAPTRDRA